MQIYRVYLKQRLTSVLFARDDVPGTPDNEGERDSKIKREEGGEELSDDDDDVWAMLERAEKADHLATDATKEDASVKKRKKKMKKKKSDTEKKKRNKQKETHGENEGGEKEFSTRKKKKPKKKERD